MKKARLLLLAAAFLASSAVSFADEGMWMIHDINEALQKNMQERGLRLSPGEIYNADAPEASVTDAIVSIGFYCTGSLLSDKGLIITNHHCAYSNLAKLSTPGNDLLENGFWAMDSSQEIPVPDEKVYFLRKVFDVTDEYREMEKKYEEKGEAINHRRIVSYIEKRYADASGLEAILSSMWGGEKRYISVYKVYTDVRLVAAPPVCIGYFGGQEDNWEWPRHNCDFTMYRIYENNVPVNYGAKLKICTSGYNPGSFAMVIGYPATTNRYASSYELDYELNAQLPLANELRSKQLEIMDEWIEKDDYVRMKYSDWYFNLANDLENDIGKQECYRRFRVIDEKKIEEGKLTNWINAADNRKAMWKDLLSDLKKGYDETERGELEKIYYRETLVRGTYVARFMMRAGNSKDIEKAREAFMEGHENTSAKVEKDLLEFSLREFYTNVDNYYYGPFLKKMKKRFGTNFKGLAEYLWTQSAVSSKARIENLKTMDEVRKDPLVQLFSDLDMSRFNERNRHLARRSNVDDLEKEYKKALYWMRLHNDALQYPDANSTMRLSYGRVGGYSPVDGTIYSWCTTTDGILEKYDPSDHDFNLNERQKWFLERRDWGKWGIRYNGKKTMFVDFLTDNDISGGNSGSPVLNEKGNLIGLAFDGNKESLASDASYTNSYNKCINTDIRYVMWVLDKYAEMDYLLEEMEFVK